MQRIIRHASATRREKPPTELKAVHDSENWDLGINLPGQETGQLCGSVCKRLYWVFESKKGRVVCLCAIICGHAT